MKKILILLPLALSLAACQSWRPVPWTFKNKETGQVTSANVSQGIVRADLKRQVVDACISALDDINAKANASYLVGKAPGGYEWYATNPSARAYGPQDCRNLMITGIDIANNAVKEVRGVLGSLANALPWVAVAKLGKYGFDAAGTRTSIRTDGGNVDYTNESIRDLSGSEGNLRSTIDNSVRQEGSENVQTSTPGAPSTSNTTILPAPEPEPAPEGDVIEPDPEEAE